MKNLTPYILILVFLVSILLCCDSFTSHQMVVLIKSDSFWSGNAIWIYEDRIILSGCDLINNISGLWSITPAGDSLQLVLNTNDVNPEAWEISPGDISDDDYIILSDSLYNIYYIQLNSSKPVFICQGSSPAITGNLDGIYNIAYFQYYISSPDDTGIYLTDIHGSTPLLIIPQGINADWSPDGKHLVYAKINDPALYVLDLDTQQPKPIYSGFSPSTPRYSPDGKWIAYTDGYNVDKAEVFIIPADGGTPERLTEFPYETDINCTGAFGNNWSPSGNWIVFNIADDELWKVSVE